MSDRGDIPGVNYADCEVCGQHVRNGTPCACGVVRTDGLGALGCGSRMTPDEVREALDWLAGAVER